MDVDASASPRQPVAGPVGMVPILLHAAFALLIVLGMVAGEHLEADALGTVRSVLIVLGIVVGVAIIAVALYNYFQVRLADLGTTMRVGITRFVDGVCAMRGERGTRQVA